MEYCLWTASENSRHLFSISIFGMTNRLMFVKKQHGCYSYHERDVGLLNLEQKKFLISGTMATVGLCYFNYFNFLQLLSTQGKCRT